MSDPLFIAFASAVLNGAVMWGVLSTKLAWLRRDVDQLQLRLQHLEDRR